MPAAPNLQFTLVADTGTGVPGTTDTFSTFFDVALDGGLVAFRAGWPGPGGGCSFAGSEGVFVDCFSGGRLTTVASSLTTTKNCFHGVDLEKGIVVVAGGVNPVDVIHNHSESIMVIRRLANLKVAFVGRDAGNATALYAGTSPATLRAGVDITTSVPGEPFHFLGVSNPIAYDGGVGVFSGFWAGGGGGLFAGRNGKIFPILKKGDPLGTGTVEQAFCRPGNKDGRHILIEVRFVSNPPLSKRALYLASF